MSFKTKFVAIAAASVLLAGAAFADGNGLMAQDAYARSSGPTAKAGAAFMMLTNHSATDDRLIGARSAAAKRVELHTHIDKGDGLMQMREIEGGIALPAGASHMMKRGGDHVMLMGLTGPLNQGESIEITLIFEKAGDMVITVPVDQMRKAKHGHGMDHSNHSSD